MGGGVEEGSVEQQTTTRVAYHSCRGTETNDRATGARRRNGDSTPSTLCRSVESQTVSGNAAISTVDGELSSRSSTATRVSFARVNDRRPFVKKVQCTFYFYTTQ